LLFQGKSLIDNFDICEVKAFLQSELILTKRFHQRIVSYGDILSMDLRTGLLSSTNMLTRSRLALVSNFISKTLVAGYPELIY